MYTDAAKFGCFATVFSSSYKIVLCFLRRMGYQDDRINAPIAGFLSALSLSIEAKGRRPLLLVLVLSRGVDSAINILEAEGLGVINPVAKYALIFMSANLFLQGSMAMAQDLLPKGLTKFYTKWAQLTRQDMQLCELYTKMLIDRVPTF